MFEPYELLIRLALGTVFGGVVGLERQINGRPAGLRTHIIVCVASVLLMEISAYSHLGGGQESSFVRVDPGRIAAGAITGIGFLGAGVILKLGPTVQGLTTAASIWMVAALGLALGAGFYIESSAAFALTLFSLLILGKVEKVLPHTKFRSVTITGNAEFDEVQVRDLLARYNSSIFNSEYEIDLDARQYVYRYTLAFKGARKGDLLLQGLLLELTAIRGVQRVAFKN